jgi:3,4-dihydroxy 2-butanone 4-phosphate synthase / GTP cyclohydrolase II
MRTYGGSPEILQRSAIRTSVGAFEAIVFRASADGRVHSALVSGAVAGPDVLTRIHSECLTGDVFGSRRCDCGEQLAAALAAVSSVGRGVVIYLRGHEGRGIGLVNKLLTYGLQDRGLDTVEANRALGLPVDARDYTPAAEILRGLGVQSVELMTNNADKVDQLARAGIPCSRTVSMAAQVCPDNESYLRTKVERMGHAGLISAVVRETA